MNFWKITETDGGVQFSLKIQPRASRNEIVGLQGDALKLRITAPPVDGEANEACIRFIAQMLKVPKSAVTIVSGLTGRNKTVHVAGLNKGELLELVETKGK
ncbi:MAG: DUF167 domain-containing protein [Clostridia bacterium]|jgi:uncharacterized protein (TIGR00251 family)|nr:DUF167 domain-containing protein [Clostridia bacterium]